MMFRCLRCGLETPRLTTRQIHCPRCEREVAALIAADAARRAVRYPARVLDRWR